MRALTKRHRSHIRHHAAIPHIPTILQGKVTGPARHDLRAQTAMEDRDSLAKIAVVLVPAVHSLC